MVAAWIIGIFFALLLFAIMGYYVCKGYKNEESSRGLQTKTQLVGPLFWKRRKLAELMKRLPIIEIEEGAMFNGNITIPMTAKEVCKSILNEYRISTLRPVTLGPTYIWVTYGELPITDTILRVGPNQYRYVHQSYD